MKVKSKSIMRGATKKHRTRRSALKRSLKRASVTVGTRNYSVPQDLVSKLIEELEPHRVEEEELLSFEEFFNDEKDSLPEGAKFLRGLRYKEDMTQEDFAAAIGVTQSNLSAMENGRRTIGKEVAKRIAEIFETNYRYFL